MGSGTRISRLLGAQRADEANTVAASGFLAAVTFGMFLTVFGLLFIDDLMRLLGATETILPYARDYAGYILYAAPVMSVSFLLNNILRAEGKARFAMVGLTTGGLQTCCLIPCSFSGSIWVSPVPLRRQSASVGLHLRGFSGERLLSSSILRLFQEASGPILKFLKTVSPSFCRQALASAATIPSM